MLHCPTASVFGAVVESQLSCWMTFERALNFQEHWRRFTVKVFDGFIEIGKILNVVFQYLARFDSEQEFWSSFLWFALSLMQWSFAKRSLRLQTLYVYPLGMLRGVFYNTWRVVRKGICQKFVPFKEFALADCFRQIRLCRESTVAVFTTLRLFFLQVFSRV